MQHSFHSCLYPRPKVVAALGFGNKQATIPILLFGFQRTAKCATSKLADKLFATCPVSRAGRLTKSKLLRLTANSGNSQFFRRCGVVFSQQWGKALALNLVFETIDKIFRWKLRSGVGCVAQQISHSVVVLAMRQPAKRFRGSHSAFRSWRSKRKQFLRGKTGQVIHPGFQQLFFRPILRNAHATRVFQTIGGLPTQQTIGRRFGIHPALQLQAEDFPLRIGSFGVGENQIGGPGNSIGDVTSSAICIFQNRVQIADKPGSIHWLGISG